MDYGRRAGGWFVRRFYPRLRFQRFEAWPSHLDGDSRRGSCRIGIRTRSGRCAGIHFVRLGVLNPRWRALLAQIERLDGNVRLVVPPCIRVSDGWSVGESGSLLSLVALVSSSRRSTPVLHDADHNALRSLSRR